ncbi:hypothetical protein Dimus_038595 [Dionaea muscipula]
MSFNPLATMLNHNKLIGDNFINWNRNLDIVLTADGTPVQDHVLKMMDHMNKLEVIGAKIDGESRIDLIPNSLPEPFQQSRVNVCRYDRDFTLTELLIKAQVVEKLVHNPVVVNVAEKSSTSGPKGQKKMKNSMLKDSTRKGVEKLKGTPEFT